MRKIDRKDILPNDHYELKRNDIREQVTKLKSERKIHLGDHFTFLFENQATMLNEVQEMIRTKNHINETEIAREIETRNELLGDKGELSCTLLIEIGDSKKRDQCLTRWQRLPATVYIETEKGDKIMARFDDRQVADRRLSTVQYLKFNIGDQIPKALGIDLEDVKSKATFSALQKAALLKDLIS